MSDTRQHEWEAAINALLDGELDQEAAAALKADATTDQKLARDIIDAYQLQRALDTLRPEAAPASLRRRLRQIPRQQRERPRWLEPRWIAAAATVPVLALALLLARPQEPSRAEVERAAAELALAFAYIEEVSGRTAARIEREVGGGLQEAVGVSVINAIPQFQTDEKETQA